MSRVWNLAPLDLADIGEVAFDLGLLEHANWMLVAAYDELDGISRCNVDDLVSEVREAALTRESEIRLTAWQRRLLQIAGLMLPLVLLCVAHCRQTSYYPNAICSHAVAKFNWQIVEW